MAVSVDVRIDIGPTMAPMFGDGTALHTAVRIVAPDNAPAFAPVVFGFPGGGYNRRYFDLDIDGHEGYSQARHHAANGKIFVACDHLGIGDSDRHDADLDVATLARANAATASVVLDGLAAGTLHPRLPPVRASCAIGIGQSYGGFLLTLAQAASPMFDGVVFLGWSALATTPPWASGLTREIILAGEAGNGLQHPKRPWFHTDEVPQDIVELDMTKIVGTGASRAPWSAASGVGRRRPGDRDPLTPGVVADEAASLRVPVFVGAGEIDVVPDPWLEPSAYRGSGDVTVCVFPRMAHMHNFAATRRVLWDRLDRWVDAISSGR